MLVLATAVPMITFAAAPNRVISLDYCADQFVLKLLPKERILAVSPDATRSFSYMRNHAVGMSQVRPLAEDVLIQSPDMVVRSYGGGTHITQFMNSVGVPVVQIPVLTSSIDSIRQSVRFVAKQLGVSQRGEMVIADFDRRIDAIIPVSDDKQALYMTPTGVTSGPSTLVHEIMRTAGYQNFETRAGWWSLPLERLAYEQPDLVVAAFFDKYTHYPNLWSAMRHPVALRQLKEQPSVLLDGAWTVCGGWFLLDAIEALTAALAAEHP